jgi:hypothetical protein
LYDAAGAVPYDDSGKEGWQMNRWERWGNAAVATIALIVAINRFVKAAEGL